MGSGTAGYSPGALWVEKLKEKQTFLLQVHRGAHPPDDPCHSPGKLIPQKMVDRMQQRKPLSYIRQMESAVGSVTMLQRWPDC